MKEPLVEIRNLSKEFAIRGGLWSGARNTVKAVQDVSLDIRKGETLGLVGESGCGKSTLGRCLLRLIEPSSGRVLYRGREITVLASAEMKKLRRRMQIVFQDPYGSLNPRMKIRSVLEEPLIIHGLFNGRKERLRRVEELLDLVGLPAESMDKYPHEFSGGQRQRIGIARALAVEPEFLVCDEPVSALDVSIQAQIINLLMDLQTRLGLTYLFIAHDLNVVRHISHRVAVMYLGRIVEAAEAETLYSRPQHPYTQALLSSVPHPDPQAPKKRILLEGDVPSPVHPPSGCAFHPRCARRLDRCPSDPPQLKETSADHRTSCWLY